MDAIIFFRGIIIGFLAAIPIGPVNVLCIQRTLNQGGIVGLVSGLGAATVDAVYGGIAGLGLTFISDILARNQAWFRIIGGLFVCWLGVRTILSETRERPASFHVNGLMAAYASTFFLTLANPTTIFSYGLLFAGFGVAHVRHGIDKAILLVLGVFLGSALWWIILSTGVGMLRLRTHASGLKWVNRVAGTAVAGFGIFLLLSR